MFINIKFIGEEHWYKILAEGQLLIRNFDKSVCFFLNFGYIIAVLDQQLFCKATLGFKRQGFTKRLGIADLFPN